jgi:hypothetical protein
MAKRECKISLFISQTARELLDSAVLEFDSPQGKLIDRMIIQFCSKQDKPASNKAPKSKRKQLTYPSNLDEQFLFLWDTKGKKGSKQKAYDKFKKMAEGQEDKVLESFTMILVKDIHDKKHEPGYPERHLSVYLNGSFWEE